MGLALRRSSKWWYAQIQAHGKRRLVRLAVEVEGARPASLREEGCAEFEASRKAAQADAERVKLDAQAESADADYHLTMARALARAKAPPPKRDDVAVLNLFEAWAKVPARKRLSPRYLVKMESVCRAFGAFAASRGVRSARDVDEATARAYVDGLRGRMAPGTVNSHLGSLRSVFARIGPGCGAPTNPFSKVESAIDSPVHRRPLSDAEVKNLVAACDPIIRGPVVTGICTALRRADACRLRWDQVDLKEGFVLVRTEKTGETAEVPIFPMLRQELIRVKGEAGKQKAKNAERVEYCWPAAARMMEVNPCGISYRVRKAMKRAGIERTAVRAVGKRRASVADFHALRTTWITKALAAGVPMELVRRVTGHSTVNVVLKHYFRPGREEFRKALAGMWGKKKASGRDLSSTGHEKSRKAGEKRN